MAAFSSNTPFPTVAVSQNATVSILNFDMTNVKSVAVSFSKSGTGSGTAKLQWSLDGAIWKDINTTQNPDATATVLAGNGAYHLSAQNFPGSQGRVLFIEGNVGPVSITGGKCLSKLY